MQITVNPALYKPTITSAGNNPFCEGRQLILLANGAVSYQWSNGATTNGITVAKSDTVTVTGVSSAGCIGTSDPFYAVMFPRPVAPTITPAGNAQNTVLACSGNTVVLTAQSTQSGVNFLWNTGATLPSISTQTNGVFSVSATDVNGCTSFSTFRGVTFYNQPAGIITANGNTTICAGDSVQLTVNTADTTVVLWNTGVVSKSIWVKTAGVYTAQLTTAQGCTKPASNAITVQVNQKPTPTITQNANTLSSTPAASYQWYFNNVIMAAATSQTLNISTGGSYKVMVMDVNGCTGIATLGAILRVANSSIVYQVYPNPAKDKIGIVYTLSESEKVTVTIKGSQGQNLITVVNDKQQAAGDYQYSINTVGLPKGLVVVSITVGDKTVSQKVMVL